MSPASPEFQLKWIKGINKLVDIAISKNIPVFLNKVFPVYSYKDNINFKKNIFEFIYNNILYFYNNIPQYINKISISEWLFTADLQNKWGPYYFHYKIETYQEMLKAFDKALENSNPSY